MGSKINRYLIIGLGNPGNQYKLTRHNVGYLCVDYLAKLYGTSWRYDSSSKAYVTNEISLNLTKNNLNETQKVNLNADTSANDISFIKQNEIFKVNLRFIKPDVYMNLSGQSIQRYVKYQNLPVSHLVAIHDDLERNLGKLSFKRQGSANGHNGISSIIQKLSTNKFSRLRIGVGRPLSRETSSVSDYVLSSFSNDELMILNQKVFPNSEIELIKVINELNK